MPLLERFCIARSRFAKPMPLPPTGKKAAIFGSGLSSLAAAWELGRKGHSVHVFHVGPPGRSLIDVPAEKLPETALKETLGQLAAVRTTFEAAENFSPEQLDSAKKKFMAVYLGFDDPALKAVDFNMSEPIPVEPATLAALTGRIFASREPSFIGQLAAGRRAAGSIDRLMQGVSPATAREAEATYPTKLYTNLAKVTVKPQKPPADPLAPTPEEAMEEAGRCIQCECLECVKNCAYLRHYKGHPKKYAREIYNNLSVVHGLRKANNMINSCAECGLCKEICPLEADSGQFIAKARLEMTAASRMPPSAHEFALEDMLYSNSPAVAFFRHQPGADHSAWLFFPGCQLPPSLPGETAAVYEHLRDRLAGGVGFALGCCGAPAKWSGRQKLTQTVRDDLHKIWEEAGRPQVILACASCSLFFQAELAEIPAITLWDVLAETELPATGRAAAEELALHDPCAARHDPKTRQSIRTIARRLEQPIRELPLSGELTRCCGYGGLASAANPEVGDLIAGDRAGDSDLTMLTYCIMCRDRLKGVGKPSLHLLNLLFPNAPMEKAALRKPPGISERQEGRLEFRRDLLFKCWGESPAPGWLMNSFPMHISEELASRLERRRILTSDLAAVLRHAKEHGAQFFNRETGRYLTSLRPRQVTFWVEYSLDDDGAYTIHDAYCHRMVVPGVPGCGAGSPASLEGYAAKGGRA
jgi:Fe-S oxidoreductase